MGVEAVESASGGAGRSDLDESSTQRAAARQNELRHGYAGSGKGSSRGFPSLYAGLTPVEKREWLAGEECAVLVCDRALQASQVQAEARRLKKAAAKVAALVPSPCRLDEFWRGYPFPPPAEHTPMRRATKVLDDSERPVLWPAHYLSSNGATYDVVVYETEALRRAVELKARRGESHAESASADALRAAEAAGAIIDTGVTLLTEDEQVLRQQIDRYLAGKKTSLLEPEEDRIPTRKRGDAETG